MHSSRPLEIASFLDQHGWSDAAAQPFDGDFSPRRYARLTRAAGQTAILMDADANQKTPHFVAVAKILRGLEIPAPEIYAAAPDQGLVLMQDFGARNIGALCDAGADAKPYLLRAVEILAKLHRGFDRANALGLDLPLYTIDLFVAQAELFLDAYVPHVKNRPAGADERNDFRAAWRAVLRPVDILPKSMILRDFMPDNLMDLGGGAVGVLDFQDAGVGPIAYDLASLCEVVRRDGLFALLPDVVAHYRDAAQSPLSPADLLRACAILSAQRHTRVLGLLARIATETGRREKLALLPRIERHLAAILAEPCLLPVREWMENFQKDNS